MLWALMATDFALNDLPPMPLALALAGLRLAVPGGLATVSAANAREAMELAASNRCRAIQWDGTAPGLRARELGRSARRDIAASLRRSGLAMSGCDVWIPPEHLLKSEHQHRAVEAIIGAAELLRELWGLCEHRGEPAVCLSIPADLPETVAAALLAGSQLHGVQLADARWPRTGTRLSSSMCVDPAAVLLAGGDVAAATMQLDRFTPATPAPALAETTPGGSGVRPGIVATATPAAALACARLSDADTAGRVLVASRAGRLDVLAYRAALAAMNYVGFVTVDLRGLGEVLGTPALLGAADAWLGPAGNSANGSSGMSAGR